MNIKKSKIALALGVSIFLAMPLSSALADQKYNDVKVVHMGDTMQFIKSELRGYVKGVRSDDAQKMQQHLNKLLTLSAMSANQSAASMDHEQMGMSEMEHANMDQDDMAMDHSNMTDGDMKMDHSNMADGDMKMDHSNMADGDMEMDHSNMADGDMKMDHSNIADGDMEMDHSNMADGDMKMDGASHDMSTMEGMSSAQHQHMLYMQGIAGLNDLFKQLEKAQDKTEIKLILGKVKAQLKKNQ
ncbi:hypothetical protein Ping_1371 [Psychromonas ingrahamii 37]|uniref:Uncharacterized protein n=1 Tax=Psychromonas ingrahamii (strain DSM 17664 / CCUG 51855 / 37) TaxID=357804 RepID=A1SUM7_PSYIN|nr:hypothetical protein [Psychromonas ingrahamii]ABM03192.1 hypothetical protein Ping_1371 [Psychromonas ingrahamii 37]